MEHCSYGKLDSLEKKRLHIELLHHVVKLFLFLELFFTPLFWILIYFQN